MTTHFPSDMLPLNDKPLTHSGSTRTCEHPPTLTPSLRSTPDKLEMQAHLWLNKGVIFPCQIWLCSCFSCIQLLSHLMIQFDQRIESKLSKNMGRCNYIVPHSSGIVEMPINCGQYHRTITSLWISLLIDNLPLSPVMVAHIASAQLTNPRQITIQPGIIISLLSQILFDVTRCSILTCQPHTLSSSVNFAFQATFDTSHPLAHKIRHGITLYILSSVI